MIIKIWLTLQRQLKMIKNEIGLRMQFVAKVLLDAFELHWSDLVWKHNGMTI